MPDDATTDDRGQIDLLGEAVRGSRSIGTKSVDPLQSIDFVDTLLTVFDPKPQPAGEKTGRGKKPGTATVNRGEWRIV
jgi:hypothetical protein